MRKILVSILLMCFFTISSFAHISSIKGVHLEKQQTEFKLEKVGGNVYALFGQGGNIGASYGKDGLFMIDTQFERIAPQIKAELKKLGSDTPKFIFNTHFHGDHTGGNPVFGQTGTIFAHENVRKRLMMPDSDGKTMAAIGLPMITYDKGISVYFNGEEIRAVFYPHGHTDGDTVLFFTGSNVVHLGDDFFAGRFPFVDLDSGGSVEGLLRNVGELIQTIPADAKLIPGHGAVSTLDDFKDYNQMLIETTLIVRKKMKEGKPLNEIKSDGLPEKYKEAGSGFIKTDAWIETIFKSYSMNMLEINKMEKSNGKKEK